MRIDQITSLQTGQTPDVKKASESGENFGEMLMDALKEVNDAQLNSRELQDQIMAGRKVEVHELVFAMERASTAMQLTMQVRNKLLEAYQEIQRMQI